MSIACWGDRASMPNQCFLVWRKARRKKLKRKHEHVNDCRLAFQLLTYIVDRPSFSLDIPISPDTDVQIVKWPGSPANELAGFG